MLTLLVFVGEKARAHAFDPRKKLIWRDKKHSR